LNWIVITSEDQVTPDSLRIYGQRYQHILYILKKKISDRIRVIIPGHKKGLYSLSRITPEFVEVVPFELEPFLFNSKFANIEIFFALPRPQTGKKILHLCGVYGIGKIHFIFPHHKNKEYLTSPLYQGGETKEIFDGMSQSGNPFVTEINYVRSPPLFHQALQQNQTFIFDPRGESFSQLGKDLKFTSYKNQVIQFVFGPESGFTLEELEVFKKMNLRIVSLGNIVLRTEYAFHGFLHETNNILEAEST